MDSLVLVVARVPTSTGTYLVVIEDHTYENRKPKFPGGRIKVGESPIEGGARELWEETGLEAKYGSNLRLVGKTTARGYDPRKHYLVYFVSIDFPNDYVDKNLSRGYREGKLVSYLARCPIWPNEERFLPKHRAWLRETSEEVYTDIFVP